jgi:hypothetical protein
MQSPPGFVHSDKVNVNRMHCNDLRTFEFGTRSGNSSLIYDSYSLMQLVSNHEVLYCGIYSRNYLLFFSSLSMSVFLGVNRLERKVHHRLPFYAKGRNMCNIIFHVSCRPSWTLLMPRDRCIFPSSEVDHLISRHRFVNFLSAWRSQWPSFLLCTDSPYITLIGLVDTVTIPQGDANPPPHPTLLSLKVTTLLFDRLIGPIYLQSISRNINTYTTHWSICASN